MDYEGNYFPDDEEELTEKQKRRKKITRYSFYGIILLVYLVAFWVIFSNCEADIYKEYVFSPQTVKEYKTNPEFKLYEVFPSVFMNFDGSVQIAGVAYADTTNELEIGIKFNKNLLITEDGSKPQFTLTDTDGKVYEVCNTVEEDKGRYRYLRIAFKGVDFDVQGNAYINSEASVGAEGEGEMFETYSVSLLVTYPEGADIKTDAEDKDKMTDRFVMLNNTTAMQTTTLD